MAKIKILRKAFIEENVSLTIEFDYGQTVGLAFPKTASKKEILQKIAEEYIKNMPPEWMIAELKENQEYDISEFLKVKQ